MLRRCVVLLAILFAAAAVYASSIPCALCNIFTVTGFFGSFGFVNQTVLVTGWSQTVTYTGVTITAPLEDTSLGGPIAGVEGVVYLVNAIGPGTTSANEVAPPVSISGLTNTFTTRTLFSGLTLGPGNHYLVFRSTNTNPLSMSMEGSDVPTVILGIGHYGGLSDRRFGDLGAGASLSPAAYPPASTVPLLQPSSLFVTVAGSPVLAPYIPTLSTWALWLLGAALLLIGMLRIAAH
jgi:hypothetical protein